MPLLTFVVAKLVDTLGRVSCSSKKACKISLRDTSRSALNLMLATFWPAVTWFSRLSPPAGSPCTAANGSSLRMMVALSRTVMSRRNTTSVSFNI